MEGWYADVMNSILREPWCHEPSLRCRSPQELVASYATSGLSQLSLDQLQIANVGQGRRHSPWYCLHSSGFNCYPRDWSDVGWRISLFIALITVSLMFVLMARHDLNLKDA